MPSTFHVKNAETYEQLMGRWSALLAVPFLDWLGKVTGNILDVGCGTGSLIAELLQRNAAAKIAAIDYEQNFVDACKTLYANEPRVEVAQGDAEQLTYQDGTFDSTLSMLTVHFISDPIQALCEMKRVTKPGGMVAATTWEATGGGGNRLFWETAAAIDPYAREMHERSLNNPMMQEEGLRHAFAQVDLQQIALTRLSIAMEYADFDEYWAPYVARARPNKFMANLAPGNAERLEAALREAFLDGRPDGPRSFPAVALACKAIH